MVEAMYYLNNRQRDVQRIRKSQITLGKQEKSGIVVHRILQHYVFMNDISGAAAFVCRPIT